ncbi:MAG: ABC transporter transmembrane domain-containing protein, partial [Succinatimonas sp.]|nr:ABC transporter transmembrane domain-containing protein [Succinatimonas sp.]
MESKKKYPILLSDVTQAANPSFIRGYRRFWPFMRKYALLAVIGMLLTIPIGALDAVVASFLRPFMDKVMVEQNKDFAYTVPLIILGFALGQGILIYIAAVVNSFVGGRISRDMKMKLFDKLLQMDTSFYDRNNTGTINFRFANDVDLAASGLMDNLKLFLTKFFSSMSLIGVLLYNSWQLS